MVAIAMYADPGYSLTYHGHNNERLRRLIGEMHVRAYPLLAALPPQLALLPPRTPAAAAAAADAETWWRGLARSPPALPRK